MNKKISVSAALAVTFIAMTVTFSVTMILAAYRFDKTVSAVRVRQEMNDKIANIDKYVRGNYYGDIDENLLRDRAGKGYIDGLNDINGVYYTAEEYTELTDIENGKRVGVGIEIARDANNYFQIVKVYPGSPADQEGVTVGGYIQKIGDIDLRTISTKKAANSLIWGEEGTELKMECQYNGETTSFTIKRAANYVAPTIEMLEPVVTDSVGYIRISSFGNETYGQFDEALKRIQENGAKIILFDVRSNNAGVNKTAYEIVSRMIDRVAPLGTIAKTEDKSGVAKVLATSDAETFLDIPMVVLTNSYTGGAAEMFAVSVRDLAGGHVVGTKTAGKGLLQGQPYRMPDGSAVAVTIAKVLTGQDESYDKVGVSPRVEIKAQEAETPDIYNINPATDVQLTRALEYTRGVLLSSGESEVPVDSSVPESSLPPEENSSASESAAESESSSVSS